MAPFPSLDGLPEAELQATRLDGESYRLAEAYVPIGLGEDPSSRAIAALGRHSSRLVAARGTAAWIWGARPAAPARLEACVDLAARWRPPVEAHLDVIETVLHPGDAVSLRGARVTSPLRTALDLVRFRGDFGDDDADVVQGLAELGGFGAAELRRALDRGRNLHGKLLAAERLASVFSRC